MEPLECVLFDEEDWEEALDDDVEMVDAGTSSEHVSFPAREAETLAVNTSDVRFGGGRTRKEVLDDGGDTNVIMNAVVKVTKKKKNKKKRRKGGSGSVTNITDINRFVINSCRQLKEKKSYLVWNAVGCLGVSALSDLLKEVEVIQRCGGQKTVDGKRMRTGGGVLWNILKTREPKAYKEIMAKGKEFERQFIQPPTKPSSKKSEAGLARQDLRSIPTEPPATNSLCASQARQMSESPKRRTSVRDRIRIPVSYDDELLEEGEILESPPLP